MFRWDGCGHIYSLTPDKDSPFTPFVIVLPWSAFLFYVIKRKSSCDAFPLPDFLTNYEAVVAQTFLAVLVLLPFLLTWLRSNLNAPKSRNGEPPVVQFTIPWLGHALFFLNDMNAFWSWIKYGLLGYSASFNYYTDCDDSRKNPSRDTLTALIAGRHMYTILDPKIGEPGLPSSLSLLIEPFNILANRVFGKMMEMGSPVLSTVQDTRTTDVATSRICMNSWGETWPE
jgi:hypothetical protein